jgi:hypothetical protein
VAPKFYSDLFSLINIQKRKPIFGVIFAQVATKILSDLISLINNKYSKTKTIFGAFLLKWQQNFIQI